MDNKAQQKLVSIDLQRLDFYARAHPDIKRLKIRGFIKAFMISGFIGSMIYIFFKTMLISLLVFIAFPILCFLFRIKPNTKILFDAIAYDVRQYIQEIEGTHGFLHKLESFIDQDNQAEILAIQLSRNKQGTEIYIPDYIAIIKKAINISKSNPSTN